MTVSPVRFTPSRSLSPSPPPPQPPPQPPPPTQPPNNLASFIWRLADLLRGDYKRADYGKVVLPFTVLRRLECGLEQAAEAPFSNSAGHTLRSVAAADPGDAATNLLAYVAGFSDNARELFERYRFTEQVSRLADAGLLQMVAARFADLDLHPGAVSNHEMGYAFEELIRKFSEDSNETAGEHFTPREVVRLMTALLVAPDLNEISNPAPAPGPPRRVYDPACGTGGMLTAAQDFILRHNEGGTVEVFGQELNAESWAICRSDLMIRGQDVTNVRLGNSLSDDQLSSEVFDYLLSNPPFGVEWKKVAETVRAEHERCGLQGRFGAGLPRVNDGSFLFLQHMISKMRPASDGGSRLAVVFNGSPLFSGAAGSGESEIRRWILDNDWLEAVVGLPDQLFYNTGISTYVWVLTNRKKPERRGKVVLLDARGYWVKMRKSLGDKRRLIDDEQLDDIVRLYSDALAVAADPQHQLQGKVKIVDNHDFGYRRVTVERPLRLRFEVSEQTLASVAASKPISRALGGGVRGGLGGGLGGGRSFSDALTPLLGTTWPSRAEAWSAIRASVQAAGLPWPSGAAFQKALRDTVGMRDPDGEVQFLDGTPEADPVLRDYENVPLDCDLDAYADREILPHVPDAWVDHEKTKVGYEIPFTRYFHVCTPPRPLAEIDAEIEAVESKIQALLGKTKTINTI